MSYYTHFYPPKDLYNENGLSSDEINKQITEVKDNIAREKILLKGETVSAYYVKTTYEVINLLKYIWKSLLWDYERLNKLEWADRIDNNMKEYKSVAINHAKCDSEYELQDNIDNSKAYIQRLFEELVILTRIRFSKENDNERYDRRDTEMSYLSSDYIQKVDEILDFLEEIEDDISLNQFMLDAYDGHKGEDELSEEENITEEKMSE